MENKTSIFIPARFASSRFPGKPLAPLVGAGGVAKSLLQRSWEAACAVTDVSSVHILTEDDRIRDAAEAFGAAVLMTSPSCRNGTERCAEALEIMDESPNLVINFQGDSPLTPPWYVKAVIAAMKDVSGGAMATPVLATHGAHLRQLRAERAAGRVGATTAVFNHEKHALYFSKEIIPFCGDYADEALTPIFHHIGVYAYTPEALTAYMASAPGPLEQLEGLEQLRFLEQGIPVRCVEVESKGRAFWELNNPDDIEIIEKIMMDEAIE